MNRFAITSLLNHVNSPPVYNWQWLYIAHINYCGMNPCLKYET